MKIYPRRWRSSFKYNISTLHVWSGPGVRSRGFLNSSHYKSEARLDNIRPAFLCLFCHFQVILLFPLSPPYLLSEYLVYMHVCIIFSLYYFFPCFTPLCVSLIVLGLFSLLFLRLFETRLSAFWVPNSQVSQALSHEGEPMGGSELYVQGLYGGKGGCGRKALLLDGPSVQMVRGSSLR